jgi:hypothetical protein
MFYLFCHLLCWNGLLTRPNQIPLLILMVGASIYHGMLGFGTATRTTGSVVPKAQAQVQVQGAVDVPEILVLAPTPQGVVPVAGV